MDYPLPPLHADFEALCRHRDVRVSCDARMGRALVRTRLAPPVSRLVERLLGWARIALPIGAVWCVSVGSGTTAAVLLIGWLLRGPLARRYISAVAIAVARDNAEAYHLLRSNGGLHATLR